MRVREQAAVLLTSEALDQDLLEPPRLIAAVRYAAEASRRTLALALALTLALALILTLALTSDPDLNNQAST